MKNYLHKRLLTKVKLFFGELRLRIQSTKPQLTNSGIRFLSGIFSNIRIYQLASRVYRRLPSEKKIMVRKAIRSSDGFKLAMLLENFFDGDAQVKQHLFKYIANPKIKISFILPYYKKRTTILNSVKSIFNQSLTLCNKDEVEVIVVDDGSEDTSVSEILPPQTTYVWSKKTGFGGSRCRNLGVKLSNGKYLVFLDPDLILNKRYIDSVLKGFKRHGDRTVFTGYLNDYFYEGCDDPRIAFGVWERPDIPCNRFLSLAAGNMAMSRTLFEEVGGFDEDLIYGEVEDTLMGYLIGQKHDTKIVYSTKMSANHIPHPTDLAHRKPEKSWSIVAKKYPEFYQKFVIEGMR